MRLETKNSEITVWLVKVPNFLAERLHELEGDIDIGELEITSATENEPASVNIKFSEKVCGSGFPTSFHLDRSEVDKQMYMLKSEKDTSGIEGKVTTECFVRPVINEEYILYRKPRNEITSGPKRMTQVIDFNKDGRIGERIGSISELETMARKRKKMLMDKKRERLDKSHVMDMLFNAFEKHKFWTVKDLADFTGQPVAYIQELISEIGMLNKKDHKNTYELKPEYSYGRDESQ
ncbi:subunit beta of transcription initiation factor IIF [Hamiltosporidium tvaerminnensis]|uniref:Transcription initiation factor IIF subunit beta n=1 Tax=Hamiltosporidium tvaerminnensis TaxID=1176355 RepID=A0A4Q9LWH7_9MICR|nr:subunit beta of transcription initiation factor IIF [Hamiltosporidium tvaerminnensis]